MNRRFIACGVALVCLSATRAYAFFEEGNDDHARLGYMKCKKEGDLSQANATGCNPWPDDDSSYTFRRSRDMKKSSVHYNATAALAVAAGFNRCAAYIIGLVDESTDVALDYDQDLWAPFPDGVSDADPQCAKLLEDNGIVVKRNIAGKAGGYIAPDFTHRAFGTSNPNEVNRESATFHWNHSDSSVPTSHVCTPIADPAPLNPAPDVTFHDMVTLSELRDWSESDPFQDNWYNPLNDCAYVQPGGSVVNGPIAAYDPLSADPKPGNLGAFGIFLHAEQDHYSHRGCINVTHGFGVATDDACGFVSGHYAGEFGTLDGKPASGSILVSTSASRTPYRVGLHSSVTVEALMRTYELLTEMLELHPELARPDAADCSGAIAGFASTFAGIPNYVPASGKASGAKKRSDLADSLFASDACKYNGLIAQW
jgi:hypothetical protein